MRAPGRTWRLLTLVRIENELPERRVVIASSRPFKSCSIERPRRIAVAHREYPVLGVQFHPESIGTPEGRRLLRNFLQGPS